MKTAFVKKFLKVLILALTVTLVLITCKKPESEMQVQTGEVTNVTANSAEVGGVIVAAGENATQYGHCYSKNQTPTINDSRTQLKNTTQKISPGSFKSTLTNLEAGTKYYVRAYITDGEALVYGDVISFTTKAQVTDADGNVYNTVQIGTQLWMQENLKTTKYNDGTSIPLVTDNTAWSNLTTPGYCWYNNDAATYKATYGALYNWYTVNTGKLCPTGWHVPTDAEWTILTDYLGGESVAGGKLKESGTAHWGSPNTGATNETGFTGLPGGYRGNNGTFVNIGYEGFWWSATENFTTIAWYRNLYYDYTSLLRTVNDKRGGFSVRCVRDY